MTIVASSPITSWQIDDEETMETVTDLFSWSPKPLQMVTAAMKLWKACSLGKKLWQTCEVKITQLCLPLCDPMDYTVHGILQARILQWVAFPFSKTSSQPRDQTQVSGIAGRHFILWATRVEGRPDSKCVVLGMRQYENMFIWTERFYESHLHVLWNLVWNKRWKYLFKHCSK